MDLHDNLITEFMSTGCESRKDAAIGLVVYLELCEEKRFWDVECKYNKDLRLLYFTAKRNRSEEASYFLPIPTTDKLTFSKMQTYFQLCENPTVNRLFLALVSADSTCVFYQISDGLTLPTDLGERRQKVSKQQQLDHELMKNRKVLEDAALCGTSVTIKISSGAKRKHEDPLAE